MGTSWFGGIAHNTACQRGQIVTAVGRGKQGPEAAAVGRSHGDVCWGSDFENGVLSGSQGP